MDENNLRPERITGTNVDRDITMNRATTGVHTDYDRDVDIRRTMIMGRDFDAHGSQRVIATAPMHRALSWGPIMAGLMTSLVSSLLFGALFLGLGFDRNYGVFGGLTSNEVGIGAAAATLLGVFVGAYLAGYTSDIRAKAEGVMNGFMVGVMSILTPLILGSLGAFGAASTAAVAGSETLPKSGNVAGVAQNVGNNIANAVPNSVEQTVRTGLTIAADNAWQVFLVGALILGVATLAGFLGLKNREKAIELQASKDLDQARTY